MALRNLFGKRAGAPDPTLSGLSPQLTASLADLNRLTAERPELAEAGRVLGRVLTAAFATPVRIEPGALPADRERITAAWCAGIPAFRAVGGAPEFDADGLRIRGIAICEALQPGTPQAEALKGAMAAGQMDLSVRARNILSDQPDSVAPEAGPQTDETLVRSVLRVALLPALAEHAARLDAMRPEGLWSRGECPDCGQPPVLAESRGLEQRRHWRCGVCAGDWPGDRLRCPFCGETDHRRLSYRFVDGEQERYRLAVCESCGGVLPVISTLTALSPSGLLISELATAHLAAIVES